MLTDTLDDSGRFMVETAERLVVTHCTPSVQGAADRGAWPAALWDAICETGLDRATLPEGQGGSGLSLAETLPLAAVAARHAAPVPLAEMLVAGSALAATTIAAPAGVLTVAPRTDARLDRARGGWRLTGTAHSVPWGGRADALVLFADAGGEARLCLLLRGDWQTQAGCNLANEPRDALSFDTILETARIAEPGGPDAAWLFAAGALARSAQIAGALARLRDLAVQYAQERVQFGRPISRFQAIQQSVAVLASDAAAAEAAVRVGLQRPDDPLAVAVAKARTGEAAGSGAAIAHQVHGAMGFTQEHRLHHLTRRLWSWRDEFGNERHWQSLLGARLLDHSPEGLWPALTAIGADAPRSGGRSDWRPGR